MSWDRTGEGFTPTRMPSFSRSLSRGKGDSIELAVGRGTGPNRIFAQCEKTAFLFGALNKFLAAYHRIEGGSNFAGVCRIT